MKIRKILNGFINAIQGNILSNRSTGRTTEIAKLVTDNDRVVFSSNNAKLEFSGVLRSIGNTSAVSLVVVDIKNLDKLLQHQRVKGATYFDHVFIELYFEEKLYKAAEQLKYMANLNCHSPYNEK